MNNIFITLKGLKIDINRMYRVSNDFKLYSNFNNIDDKINKVIKEGYNQRMQFILEDESRMSSYLHTTTNEVVNEDSNYIIELYHDLNLYLNCLWLVTDFSVIVKEGIQFNKGSHYILDLSSLTFYNSNLKLDFFYKEGERPISKNNLGHAKGYFNKLKSFNEEKKETKIEMRILRSIAFVNESRKTNNSYVRIAFLIMSLECLLSNNKGESVTNTALKSAYLISLINDKESFNSYYKFFKKCYGIRSTFVHGDKFNSKDIEITVEKSKKLESIIKSIIKKSLDSSGFRNKLSKSDQIINELTTKIKI